MKKTFQTFLFLTLIMLTSCSVYEDIYFSDNGQVKYEMMIDGSELMSIMGSSSLKTNRKDYPKDSIINFSQIVKDTLKNVPADIQQDLKNIEPIYMRVQNNDSLGILKISLYGDFDNIEAFTDAFKSMSNIENTIKKENNNPLNKLNVNSIFSRNNFTWDGTTLKRTVAAKGQSDGEEKDKFEKDVDESMNRLFSQGSMVVKYHFPKKIKSVNNDNAAFSMDGKTAIINYPASLFLDPNDELSVEIITE